MKAKAPAAPQADAAARAPAAELGSARSVLLTLLGEFVYPSDAPIWTSTLLYAFAAVGIAEKSARQALARAASAGWIEGDRDGRRASWRISPRMAGLIAEGSQRVRGLRHAAAWNGEWLVLHVSLPESHRVERVRLYKSLSWLGFGCPTPGLWICPHADRLEAARARVDDLGLTSHTIAFSARAAGLGIPERELVRQAWDLETIAGHYASLLAHFGAARPRTPQAVLAAHIELVNALQRLPATDPGLPSALLPPDWAGVQAARRLGELRARWRDAAHAHWREACER